MRSISILFLALLAFPAGAATPEGRWVLVEQYYGNGSNNMASEESPLTLDLRRDGARIVGRIWAGDDESEARTWPAFVGDSGPIPVEIVDPVRVGVDGTIRVRYRFRPSETGDLILDIVEEYAPSQDGQSLSGTVTVKLTGGEKNRGGYVLHRRFERRP